MATCCKQFDNAREELKIVHDGTGWQINGCCGQCFLLSDLQHCPWCGRDLQDRKRATPGTRSKGRRKAKDQMTLTQAIKYAVHIVTKDGTGNG